MDDDLPAAARAALDRSIALIDDRQFVDALPFAEEATRLAPDHRAAHWNLAVACKHALRWSECLAACDRALGLDPSDAAGLHWNAGIAATALGRWRRARAAWREVGVDLDDSDAPIAMELGATPIRLDAGGSPEVVWGRRIDPCRIVITSIPTPATGHGHGDLVLHDGEPRGRRQLGERSVAVFDALTRLERSPFATWQVEVEVADAAALTALTERFAANVEVEDWTATLEHLCAACSLGEPHEHHDRGDGSWQRCRTLAVAATSERDLRPLRGRLGGWRREVRSVERVL